MAAFPVVSPLKIALIPVVIVLAALSGCDDVRRPPVATRATVVGADGIPVISPTIPKLDPLRPRRAGRLDTNLVNECSGFAVSKKYPGVFWTLSDSGDSARIFAVTATGDTVPHAAGAKFSGIRVPGARNVDWEALAVDESGRMVIGDIGNNLSRRTDLCLYVLPGEPDPSRAGETATPVRIPFRYADQDKFPDSKRNHDAEALFCHRGRVYVFTKHWSDTASVLHRIDLGAAGSSTARPTIPVARFESRGMVTDAAMSPDGRRLAVLTYSGVWVFTLPTDDEAHPLSGRVLYRPLAFPLTAWQVEAVAFSDNETLLIGCEEGDLFRVALSDLGTAD